MSQSSKPPYPSFPSWCFYAIIMCIVSLIICIITMVVKSKDENKDSEEAEKQKKISGVLAFFFIISILGLILFGGGCSTWYNYSKHRWIMQYGSKQQREALMLQDTLQTISNVVSMVKK